MPLRQGGGAPPGAAHPARFPRGAPAPLTLLNALPAAGRIVVCAMAGLVPLCSCLFFGGRFGCVVKGFFGISCGCGFQGVGHAGPSPIRRVATPGRATPSSLMALRKNVCCHPRQSHLCVLRRGARRKAHLSATSLATAASGGLWPGARAEATLLVQQPGRDAPLVLWPRSWSHSLPSGIQDCRAS